MCDGMGRVVPEGGVVMHTLICHRVAACGRVWWMVVHVVVGVGGGDRYGAVDVIVVVVVDGGRYRACTYCTAHEMWVAVVASRRPFSLNLVLRIYSHLFPGHLFPKSLPSIPNPKCARMDSTSHLPHTRTYTISFSNFISRVYALKWVLPSDTWHWPWRERSRETGVGGLDRG